MKENDYVTYLHYAVAVNGIKIRWRAYCHYRAQTPNGYREFLYIIEKHYLTWELNDVLELDSYRDIYNLRSD